MAQEGYVVGKVIGKAFVCQAELLIDPMGSSEWAQGPVCPQPVLRAALGAAPQGSTGGAGHHGSPLHVEGLA